MSLKLSVDSTIGDGPNREMRVTGASPLEAVMYHAFAREPKCSNNMEQIEVARCLAAHVVSRIVGIPCQLRANGRTIPGWLQAVGDSGSSAVRARGAPRSGRLELGRVI